LPPHNKKKHERGEGDNLLGKNHPIAKKKKGRAGAFQKMGKEI